MYTFLHEWNGDLEVTLMTVGDKIQQLFELDCPKTKLQKVQKMDREILRANHVDLYTCLGQLVATIEDMDSSQKVYLETE